MVHNNPAGFAVSKAKLTPTPRTSTRVRFPPLEVLMDLTARGDADGVRAGACYANRFPPNLVWAVQVEKVLKEGADPKARNADGLTPLHKCVSPTHIPPPPTHHPLQGLH